MTAKEDLTKTLLTRKTYCVERESPKFDWVEAYEALLGQIVGWIRELPPGLVRVTRHEIALQALGDLGTYRNAPTLDLDLCDALLCVAPVARTPVGGVTISRMSKEWQLFLRPDGGWDVTEEIHGYKGRFLATPKLLTAETFYGVLCDLLR
jgi:hypothetical protein